MHWIYLIIASVFEIGWPFGFKMATLSTYKYIWIIFAVISMALSGYFLYLAQQKIDISIAYIIWTGLGAAGTLLIGIIYFNEPYSLLKLFFFFMILTGIIGLKLTY
ncbi:MAG TPA: multidrug efflux SMR transporter [Ignavibacteriales bacterium]|nr:multidrug efflux SMR transporter [Ignavibacteriales bacterium]HOL81509.1 multidrug efflux SMR transporter [Ignavibacteriales bacterium]HOM65407.1 multidrug efflux SMR transporter [Ignavibacteriales bacterium]HPD67036.1 multidrug efflux SMR transporter [Ignavibacteriales bacterium]HPP33564.1 multidrug efflux SMR transporter [Ignavibacteriales bacterium]